MNSLKEIIRPPNLMFKGIDAFFTTRLYDNNMQRWAGRVFCPIQRHTDNVYILEHGVEDMIADAVITKRRGILIGVKVADCVPVLLYDRRRHIIGAVHAGWRGTAKGIIKKAINAMISVFGSAEGDIIIATGPSIKACCYEVDNDVMESVYKATGEGDYYKGINGKYHIDLSMANIIQARAMGIHQENIWYSEECTFCNPSRFYSYRYSGGSSGRQGGFIGIE